MYAGPVVDDRAGESFFDESWNIRKNIGTLL